MNGLHGQYTVLEQHTTRNAERVFGVSNSPLGFLAAGFAAGFFAAGLVAAVFFAAGFFAADFAVTVFALVGAAFLAFFCSGYATLGVVRKERVMVEDANRGARDLAREAVKRPGWRATVR